MIIRTSWLYGKNYGFVHTIIKQSETPGPIYVPDGQIGSPTSGKELAKAIVQLINQGEDGTYHIACTGSVSRLDFAKKIVQLLGRDNEVLPLTEVEGNDIEKRPSYSALDNFMLRMSGLDMPLAWEQALENYLVDMGVATDER